MTGVRDVAKAAGVSIATVSRYLNDSGYVKLETKEKLQRAIKELGYRSNKTTGANKSKTIEVYVPNLVNPFYGELLEELSSLLERKNYSCTLKIRENCYLSDLLARLRNNVVGGIICVSPVNSDQKFTGKLPIVSLDRLITKNIPIVTYDNKSAGVAIAQQLIEKNVHRVLMLSGNKSDYYPVNDRIKGIVSTLTLHGVPVTQSYVDSLWSVDEFDKHIKVLLENSDYDGICCTDDINALRVQLAIKDIERKIVITGFDGTKLITSLYPDLLTMRQPINKISKILVKVLFQEILGEYDGLEKVYVVS